MKMTKVQVKLFYAKRYMAMIMTDNSNTPLTKPLILLEKNNIKKILDNESITIDIFEKINSTNDFLKHTPSDKKTKVCIAEMQTQGRGRLGRAWHSPFGQNIYLSLQYTFEKNMSELSGLSLISALAVAHAIESLTKIDPINIKWPNDIFIKGKKIAGILIECQTMPNGFCQAIIGMGINVNMENADENKINQAWSSLKKVLGHDIDRNELSAVLINSLITYLSRFSEKGLSDFLNEWKKKDCLFKQPITLISGSHQFSGTAEGINAQGHLLLMLEDKTVRAFSSGDAHILKSRKNHYK